MRLKISASARLAGYWCSKNVLPANSQILHYAKLALTFLVFTISNDKENSYVKTLDICYTRVPLWTICDSDVRENEKSFGQFGNRPKTFPGLCLQICQTDIFWFDSFNILYDIDHPCNLLTFVFVLHNLFFVLLFSFSVFDVNCSEHVAFRMSENLRYLFRAASEVQKETYFWSLCRVMHFSQWKPEEWGSIESLPYLADATLLLSSKKSTSIQY